MLQTNFRLKPISESFFNRLHSIAVQLFMLFFISIIIPVLIGGYLSYKKSARMIEDQVSQVASLTIKQVSDNLNFIFKGLDNTSMRLLSNKTIHEALQAENTPSPYESFKMNSDAKDFIISLMMNSPEIMDIYVLDIHRQNSVVSSPIQSMVNPWESDWYRKTVEADGRTVWFGLSDTSYLKGVNMGIPVFGLGRTLKDVDTGKLVGVLFIEVRGKVLTDTLDDIRFGETGYTFLVDGENRFTYHRDASLLGRTLDFSLPGQTQVLKRKDKEMMVIPAELGNGWRVAGMVPVQELVSSSVEIRDLTVWIALASVLVALTMGYYAAHRIGRPLVYLSKLMKRGRPAI
ncbi:cache domain-containing protein [Paenibacillus sp. P26]|nr:cache domain-containing protein [Paenibacillus sp. P26]